MFGSKIANAHSMKKSITTRFFDIQPQFVSWLFQKHWQHILAYLEKKRNLCYGSLSEQIVVDFFAEWTLSVFEPSMYIHIFVYRVIA